jgi:hypothetical protein
VPQRLKASQRRPNGSVLDGSSLPALPTLSEHHMSQVPLRVHVAASTIFSFRTASLPR